MAQLKERICTSCGKIEETFSRNEVCASCYFIEKQKKSIKNERATLEELTYREIVGPTHNKHNQRQWEFIAPCCGTKQTWTFSNILKQKKINGDKFIPCSNCGSKRRTQYALAGYLKNHARTYDLSVYEDYCRRVRMLSDKAFNQNQALLNPNNVKRSVNEWHLDHKVPIIVCFLEGLTIEQAASLKNLQLMDAKNNLSKGKYYFTMEMVDELKQCTTTAT